MAPPVQEDRGDPEGAHRVLVPKGVARDEAPREDPVAQGGPVPSRRSPEDLHVREAEQAREDQQGTDEGHSPGPFPQEDDGRKGSQKRPRPPRHRVYQGEVSRAVPPLQGEEVA